MNMIKALILDGKLPFNRIWFRWALEYALPIALAAVLAVTYYLGTMTELTEDLGEIAWNLLLLILFVSPVSKIFPEFGILRTLSSLRKEFGVGMFYMALAHGLSHFPILIEYSIYALPNYIVFGLAALFLTSLLYLTSNKFSMKLLKGLWKWVHKLIYVVLVLTYVHIYFIEPELEIIIEAVLVLGGLALVKILAARKFEWRFGLK